MLKLPQTDPRRRKKKPPASYSYLMQDKGR